MLDWYLFQGIRPSIATKPYILVIFQGGGVRTPGVFWGGGSGPPAFFWGGGSGPPVPPLDPQKGKKSLRRDCICSIVNADIEIGLSGVYLH